MRTERTGNDGRMKVTSLDKTCSACPSQWEGQLEDGRYIYGRYRFGLFYVSAAPTLDQAIRASASDPEVEILAEYRSDDSWGGVMGTDEMMRRAGLEYA